MIFWFSHLSPALSYLVYCKVQIFLEGRKNLRNLLHGFDIYLVNVKTMKKIAQIFMAFSKKLYYQVISDCKRFSFYLGTVPITRVYEKIYRSNATTF